MRWVTHGKWGTVVAIGLSLTAVLLIYYGWAAAVTLTVFTVIGAALYAVFVDQPRDQPNELRGH